MNNPHPLKSFRDQRGITQSDLAAILGVTQSQVSHWESGFREICPSRAMDIEEQTGISAALLCPVLQKVIKKCDGDHTF